MGGREVWGNWEATLAKDAGSWGSASAFTPSFFKLEPFVSEQSCGEIEAQGHLVVGSNLLHGLVNVHSLKGQPECRQIATIPQCLQGFSVAKCLSLPPNPGIPLLRLPTPSLTSGSEVPRAYGHLSSVDK